MALQIADRVYENGTVSVSTGSVLLSGAVSGYVTFASTLTSGNTTYYCIHDVSAGNWEVGVGTFTSSPNTLARTTVLSNSSGTTALISFSTSNTLSVFITYPSGKSINYAADNSATIGSMTISAAGAVAYNGSYGTAGYVLATQGSGSPPIWTAVSGPITQNTDTVSINQTIATGYNGSSVGPMKINPTYSVTIASGQRWLVF